MGNVAPLEFPKKELKTKYKFYTNSTILNTLILSTNNTNKHDTEVDDLNEVKLNKVFLPPVEVNHKNEDERYRIASSNNVNDEYVISKNCNVINITKTIQDNPDFDAELIQPDKNSVMSPEDHVHPYQGRITFVKEQWPALLAGVFTLIAVSGYVGLLLWRKILE